MHNIIIIAQYKIMHMLALQTYWHNFQNEGYMGIRNLLGAPKVRTKWRDTYENIFLRQITSRSGIIGV